MTLQNSGEEPIINIYFLNSFQTHFWQWVVDLDDYDCGWEEDCWDTRESVQKNCSFNDFIHGVASQLRLTNNCY